MPRYNFAEPPPFKHQRTGVVLLGKHAAKHGILLHWDPGTGKTRPILDYIGALHASGMHDQDWLIAAPLSALDGWPEQAAAYLPDIQLEIVRCDRRSLSIEGKAARIRRLGQARGVRIVLVNHGAFQSRVAAKDRQGRRLATVTVWDRIVQAVERHPWTGIVLDECHRMKGATSNRSRAFQRFGELDTRRIGLTGTLMPHSQLDVYGQMGFVDPQLFQHTPTWTDFKLRYARWGGVDGYQVKQYLRGDEMRRLLRKRVHTIQKKDVLDLPPVTDVTIPVQLTSKEKRVYQKMHKEMMAEVDGDTVSVSTPLTKALRLRQITSGFVGQTDELGDTEIRDIGTSKLDTLFDLLEDLQKEPVVIFCDYTHELDMITEKLERHARTKSLRTIPYRRVDGSTAPAHRLVRRHWFRDAQGARVLLAQADVLSLGVNELVVSAYAIFFSIPARRESYQQDRDRLDRQGQIRPVTLYHLVVPRSVDATLLKRHHRRADDELRLTVRELAEMGLE